MTLQQLEYIVALDTHRRFSTAASQCHVSQPSLSALVQKLEEELGVKIFDRSRQPVVPTDVGQQIIIQARLILGETEQLRQIVGEHRETISGVLRIGVIPTVAPYLLPLFLKRFSELHPDVNLSIRENTTDQLIELLRTNQIDAAILATPLHENFLYEEVLFYEEFAAYAPHEPDILNKHYLLAEEIEADRLILLEEGHCMRSQVSILCALQRAQSTLRNITYEAGSLETLKRLVETHSGITILPQLALMDLTEDQMQYIRFFQPPAPVREISMVSRRIYTKRRLLDVLKETILATLPTFLKENRTHRVLGIS